MENWLLTTIFSYPISMEQAGLMYKLGVNGNLWVLRLISLLLLVIGFWFWKKAGQIIFGKNVVWLSVSFVAISPMILVMWLVYPLLCVKLFLFCLGFYVFSKNLKYGWILALMLIFFNILVLNNKPAVLSELNLKDAQNEVVERFAKEDALSESITFPLWFRRISYNKYYIAYKRLVGKVLPFFDFETLFFQEINPLSQKSLVIFFWPQFYLFIVGLFHIVRKRMVVFLLGLSWIDFIFTDGDIFKRFMLAILPVSIVISFGFYNLYLLAKNKNIPSMIAFYSLSLLLVFAVGNSFYDLSVRKDYWLDNRPIAFEFWYKNIKQLDLEKYDKVWVSSLVGDSKPFCFYYLGDKCNDRKFVFQSFDISSQVINRNSVYAGFGGEFVGSSYTNNIDGNWAKTLSEKNIEIINRTTLRDTIANKYGNDIGIGVAK